MDKNASIMESSIEDLLVIILQQMRRFEDATQDTEDLETANVIDQSVIELDTYYHKIKNSGNVSTSDRNSIRLICKETYKMIPEKVAIKLENQTA